MEPAQYQIEGHPCPTCGHKLDGVTCTDPKAPKPRENDVTVCAYCGDILAFNADHSLRRVQESDLEALSDDQLILVNQASLYFRQKCLKKDE